MTDALTDGKNLIVVAVDNSANDRVYPQKADFTFYGGMYRDVNIIAVNKSHFDLDYYGGNGLKVTPEVADKNAKIAVEVFLSGEKQVSSWYIRLQMLKVFLQQKPKQGFRINRSIWK